MLLEEQVEHLLKLGYRPMRQPDGWVYLPGPRSSLSIAPHRWERIKKWLAGERPFLEPGDHEAYRRMEARSPAAGRLEPPDYIRPALERAAQTYRVSQEWRAQQAQQAAKAAQDAPEPSRRPLPAEPPRKAPQRAPARPRRAAPAIEPLF